MNFHLFTLFAVSTPYHIVHGPQLLSYYTVDKFTVKLQVLSCMNKLHNTRTNTKN